MMNNTTGQAAAAMARLMAGKSAYNPPPAPAASRGASGSTAPKISTPAAPAINAAQVNAAAEQARKAERERWAAVFASSHSRGRERACVAALESPKNWSAAQIVATLPKLPTDAAAMAEIQADRARASASVWDQAIVANNPGHKLA